MRVVRNQDHITLNPGLPGVPHAVKLDRLGDGRRRAVNVKLIQRDALMRAKEFDRYMASVPLHLTNDPTQSRANRNLSKLATAFCQFPQP